MDDYCPHLLECTISDDTQQVYMLGFGVDIGSLSDKEKRILDQSNSYLKDKEIAQLTSIKTEAYRDFERLRDLPNMPDEAIAILKEWTTRPGDEDELEE
jgi:hypothetical protein